MICMIVYEQQLYINSGTGVVILQMDEYLTMKMTAIKNPSRQIVQKTII